MLKAVFPFLEHTILKRLIDCLGPWALTSSSPQPSEGLKGLKKSKVEVIGEALRRAQGRLITGLRALLSPTGLQGLKGLAPALSMGLQG